MKRVVFTLAAGLAVPAWLPVSARAEEPPAPPPAAAPAAAPAETRGEEKDQNPDPAAPQPEKKPAQTAQAAPPPTPAPAPNPAEDPRDRVIQELRRTVDELTRRVEELEKQKQQPAPPEQQVPPRVPPGPPVEPPAPTLPPPSPRGPAGAATFIPNISAIGNIIFRGGDSKAIPGRGRSHFEEFELAFQDQIAPKLRYDVFVAAEKEEDWNVHLEEGFVTATALFNRVNGRAGRIRVPIGRFNPYHPHQWLFITRPAAHTALIGGHGLISDGFLLEYLLPTRKFYGALQLGRWQTAEIHGHEEEEDDHGHAHASQGDHDEEHGALGFRAGQEGAYSARAFFGKELGRDKELELGFGRYWGRGELEGFGRKMMALNSIDLSYRSYPGAYRRLWLLAELLAHETRGVRGDTKIRPGGFLMGAYRWNQYWEAGVRGDYTRFPFPVDGREVAGSLFLTRYLNEQTSLRLEYRHAVTTGFGHNNGIFFQLLFGSGPHVHPLQ